MKSQEFTVKPWTHVICLLLSESKLDSVEFWLLMRSFFL